MKRLLVVLFTLAGLVGPVSAHLPILTLDTPEAKKGVPVTATLRYGHPFENEWEDCPEPESVILIAPDKTRQTLKPEKSSFKQGDKAILCWKFQFTPENRGDYLLRCRAKPIQARGQEPAVRETTETWVHVQREQGWSQLDNEGILCLTRPYGLQPGMVFQGQRFGTQGKALGATIEWERLNETPPKELPKGPLITFTGRTDDQGKFLVSFPKPGWWGITSELRETQGMETTLHRHILWLYVDKAD